MKFQDKSAFLEINFDEEHKHNHFKIFMQNGFVQEKNKAFKLNTPIDFYNEDHGGVRSVFKLNKEYFLLISNKKINCYYASLYRLSDKRKLLESKCIEDADRIDFSGLGGGYVEYNDSILLSIGTPTHYSDKIDNLAQSNNSIFGKILKIKKNDLLNMNIEKINYEIFTKGHRNPQGLAVIEKKIFSLEHGPRGGDELNIIENNKNYGWPIYSYGVRYDGKGGYIKKTKKDNFVNPIYTFLPAIAPSSLAKCPLDLDKYYKENLCLMGLSLRARSIFVFLLDKKLYNLVSVEKIYLEERLRHFGIDKSKNLFQNPDGSFYITTDSFEIIKVNFFDFENTYEKN